VSDQKQFLYEILDVRKVQGGNGEESTLLLSLSGPLKSMLSVAPVKASEKEGLPDFTEYEYVQVHNGAVVGAFEKGKILRLDREL